MRKPDFCLCENKGADQLLRSICEADQCLCFHYTDSTIPLLSKSKISSFFCYCTGWLVSVLVGNPEVRFSLYMDSTIPHDTLDYSVFKIWVCKFSSSYPSLRLLLRYGRNYR